MQEIINIILSYLIGSISGSMVLGYLKGIDIRNMGSGNAGGTNAFRTVGASFALGVIAIDILKGIVAVLIRVLSNQTAEAIAKADLVFIDKIGFKKQLSQTRANGLVSMIKEMKLYALAYQNK